jgi:hypothetical protein
VTRISFRRNSRFLGFSCGLVILLFGLDACGSSGLPARAFPGVGPSYGVTVPSAQGSPSPTPVNGDVCSSTDHPYPVGRADGGRYTVEPDEWNGSGTICLRIFGATGFALSRVDSIKLQNPAAPGAYPNISTVVDSPGMPVPVAQLGDATSDWVTAPARNGKYDVAYDLWYGNAPTGCAPGTSAELMVWLRSVGGARPIGSRLAQDVSLAGVDYQVYESPGSGSHSVISYVREKPTDAVHGLNLRLFTEDAVLRGYVPPASYLCKVSAGFEVWSGGAGLTTDSFAFHNRSGLPVGEVGSLSGGDCLVGQSGSGDWSPVALVPTCQGQAEGSWTLGNDGSLQTAGQCLGLSSGTLSKAPQVGLAPCDGSAAQHWQPSAGNGLTNRQSGSCLEAEPATAGASGSVRLVACDQQRAQGWLMPHNDSVGPDETGSHTAAVP